jgi:hypothetical protein
MSSRPPDMIHVAITMPDESVAIMGFVTVEYSPAGEIRYERLATADAIDAEILKTFPGLFGETSLPRWRFVTAADVPRDRSYRNAWRDNGTAIYHDIEHARSLHRDLLRAQRAQRFAQLDLAYMRADERGDAEEKSRIAREKQRLRDITKHPAIDAAATVEELKAVGIDLL